MRIAAAAAAAPRIGRAGVVVFFVVGVFSSLPDPSSSSSSSSSSPDSSASDSNSSSSSDSDSDSESSSSISDSESSFFPFFAFFAGGGAVFLDGAGAFLPAPAAAWTTLGLAATGASGLRIGAGGRIVPIVPVVPPAPAPSLYPPGLVAVDAGGGAGAVFSPAPASLGFSFSTMAHPSTWSENIKLTSSPAARRMIGSGTWSILWWCPHVFKSVSTASSSCSSHAAPSALPCRPSKFLDGHRSHPPQSCVSDTVPSSNVNRRRSSSLLIELCSSVPSPFTTFCKLSLLSCRWNTFSSMEPVARKRYR